MTELLQLLDSQIAKIPDWSSRVASPLKNAPKIEKNPVIMALDTECTRDRLLSVQLATQQDGQVLQKIYYITGNSFTISTPKLLSIIRKFARETKLHLKTDIYLLTHSSFAELRHLNDVLQWSVTKVSNGLHAQRTVSGHVLHILDTYPIFTQSLEQVGNSIGIYKIPLNGLGRDEKYWKTHMGRLKHKHRSKFEKYALRDVEILIKAFHQWRTWFLKNYQLDILKCLGAADIAAKLFRHQYMKTPLDRVRAEVAYPKTPNSSGQYVPRQRTIKTFNGSLDVRKMALRCAWGARNESLVYGLLRKPV